MNSNAIERRFTFHTQLDADQRDRLEACADLVKTFAHDLDALLLDGREKAIVLTKLEELSFFANASIARGED